MARNLQVGETVYVSRARLGLGANAPSAFLQAEVMDLQDRSVRVKLPDGTWSDGVATSAVHRNIGVLILRIGDFATETTLLDPLAKSVLQYFRLLLSDDMVCLCRCRSMEELKHFWQQLHGAYSHVVIIGHGKQSAIQFGVNGWLTAQSIIEILESSNPGPKSFLSLCCKTGYAAFAKPFSQSSICDSLIAPFHSVHGAVASQFCQTYFAHHLLSGDTVRVAFTHSRTAIPGGTHFRLWQKGNVTGDE